MGMMTKGRTVRPVQLSADELQLGAVRSCPIQSPFSTLGGMHGHGTGRPASLPVLVGTHSATLCLSDGEPEGRSKSHLEDEDEKEEEEEEG